MTKKQIKQIFHEQGVQINNDAVEMVLEQLKKETMVMAERCKQGKYKRMTPEHFWVALGTWGIEPSPRKKTP